jgi:hypothetical protein
MTTTKPLLAGLFLLALLLFPCAAARAAAPSGERGAYLGYMHRLAATDGACLRAHAGIAEGLGPRPAYLRALAARLIAACQKATPGIAIAPVLGTDAAISNAEIALDYYIKAVHYCAVGWQWNGFSALNAPEPPAIACPDALSRYATVRALYLAQDRRFGVHAVTW